MSESSGFILPASTCRISLGLVATLPSFTSPVRPSNESQSPFLDGLAADLEDLGLLVDVQRRAPTTDGRPIWRPTTAACDVMPPVAVRTPCATSMPWMSSGTVSLRTRSTFLPCSAHATAWSGREHHLPRRRAGRRRQALGRHRQLLPFDRVEHRREQLRQRRRLDQQQRLPRLHQLLGHDVGRDHDRRVPGALAVAGLQHVELLVLDRELEVLDVLVVLLEPRRDRPQLLVRLRHHVCELGDLPRRADAGHHVLALGVDQELAEELVRAGRRVAREADARRRPLAPCCRTPSSGR